MKKQTIKRLIKHLKTDSDFLSIFKESIQNEIDKSKSILTDILFQSFKATNDNQVKTQFNKSIENFINGMEYESLMNFYLLDKRYIDLSYIEINDDLINLDDLYMDWKSYCQG
jgi:hypothetical protein